MALIGTTELLFGDKTTEDLIIVPHDKWQSRILCEYKLCLSTKLPSGYCRKHEDQWLRRRQLYDWLKSFFRRAPKTPEMPLKPPRSPRELGLYD